MGVDPTTMGPIERMLRLSVLPHPCATYAATVLGPTILGRRTMSSPFQGGEGSGPWLPHTDRAISLGPTRSGQASQTPRPVPQTCGGAVLGRQRTAGHWRHPPHLLRQTNNDPILSNAQ